MVSERECLHATELKFLQEEELREEKDFLINFLREFCAFFEVRWLGLKLDLKKEACYE